MKNLQLNLNNEELVDKHKDHIFNKLCNMSNKDEYKNWKDNNFKKLGDHYKTCIQQLKKGNQTFLDNFNLMYSNARYQDLAEYLTELKKKKAKKENQQKA